MTQLLEQANQMLDIRRIQENDDYVNHLPPQNQELFLDYAKSEMLCWVAAGWHVVAVNNTAYVFFLDQFSFCKLYNLLA